MKVEESATAVAASDTGATREPISRAARDEAARVIDLDAFTLDPEVYATSVYGSAGAGRVETARHILAIRRNEALAKADEILALSPATAVAASDTTTQAGGLGSSTSGEADTAWEPTASDLRWMKGRAAHWSTSKREDDIGALAWNFLKMLREWKRREATPDTGAQAVIRDGKIEISVAVANLPAIVSGSCASYGLDGLWKVTDAEAFAKDVCHALNDEREDGTTRVHIMFDKAFDHAIDQGAEGVEGCTQEEFERLSASFQASPLPPPPASCGEGI